MIYPQLRLLTPIAMIVGTLGLNSLAIANLTIDRTQNLTIAQNHEGMNHGKQMNHSMDIGPADANYDLRFIDSMIPHHQGGVIMAQEVLRKSKRPQLIKLAKGIINEQKSEISQMQKCRQKWYPTASATPMMWHAEMNHEMAMTPAHKQSMMMSMSLGKADAGFDKRFLDAMIPHHQGALTMSQDALQKSKRPQIRKLSESIIASQKLEIESMTKWRREWYGNN